MCLLRRAILKFSPADSILSVFHGRHLVLLEQTHTGRWADLLGHPARRHRRSHCNGRLQELLAAGKDDSYRLGGKKLDHQTRNWKTAVVANT